MRGADCLDRAVGAQALERAERTGHGVVIVIVGIMHQQDVDAVEPKTRQALLHRSHHAVITEIEHRPLARRALVMRVLGGSAIGRTQQAADLGGDGVGVTRLLPQECAKASLREAKAVQRRGVEEADSERPGAGDRRFRIGIADGAEQSAERGGTEAE
ncbi:hypothetical protein ACVWW4_004663 [Bradyrhizobium sp. LB7.1]